MIFFAFLNYLLESITTLIYPSGTDLCPATQESSTTAENLSTQPKIMDINRWWKFDRVELKKPRVRRNFNDPIKRKESNSFFKMFASGFNVVIFY